MATKVNKQNSNPLKIRKIKWHDLPLEHKEGQIAQDSHYDELITESTLIFSKDKVVAAYLTPNIDFEPLREMLLKVKLSGTVKNGLRVTARQFGNQKNGPTDFQAKCPEAFETLVHYGSDIAMGYDLANPVEFKKHLENSKRIPSESILGSTPFTNGIINKDAVLPYHFDTGSFSGANTCTYNIRKNTSGGYLVMPSLKIAFECADKTICIFDGNLLLHGVTPIRKMSDDAYRYSVLYYTSEALASAI